MEYSLAEQLLLALSELGIEIYHVARDRPRSFWGAWTLACPIAALCLLRPGRGRDGRDAPAG